MLFAFSRQKPVKLLNTLQHAGKPPPSPTAETCPVRVNSPEVEKPFPGKISGFH